MVPLLADPNKLSPDAEFGIVDGVPVTLDLAEGVATAFPPGKAPVEFSGVRFREEAVGIDKAAFILAIAASQAGT